MVLRHAFLGEFCFTEIQEIEGSYFYFLDRNDDDKGYVCRELSDKQVEYWENTIEISEKLMYCCPAAAHQIPEIFTLFDDYGNGLGKKFIVLNIENGNSYFTRRELESNSKTIVSKLQNAKLCNLVSYETWLGMLQRDISIDLR